jgi:hypothetical protein
MPPTIVRNYQEELLETMRDVSRFNKWWSSPINLGGIPGTSGGSGTPIGGTFGYLPQQRVAYDTTEAAYLGIQTNVPSGTLYDNLSHIRYRLNLLELASGIIPVGIADEGTSLGNATVLNFVGDGVVATLNEGTATITVSASSGGGGGVTDHGALTGLLDDDHTQYLLVTGSRNVTGLLTFDSGAVFDDAVTFNGTYTGLDFIGLDDTPSTYTGQAGRAVVVNGTENGLEFTTISGIGGGSASLKFYTTISGGGWLESSEVSNNFSVFDTGGTGAPTWNDTANSINDNLTDFAYADALQDEPYIVFDMGSTKTIDAVRIYNDSASSDVPDDWFNIWLSSTGAFGGEEEFVAEWETSPPAYTGGWIEYIFNESDNFISSSAGRYVKMQCHKASANWWRIHEFSVRTTESSLIISNFPVGCKGEIYNNIPSLLETKRRTNLSVDYITFTSSGIDRIKLYEPDGTTLFLDTGQGWVPDIGSVYVVWPYG